MRLKSSLLRSCLHILMSSTKHYTHPQSSRKMYPRKLVRAPCLHDLLLFEENNLSHFLMLRGLSFHQSLLWIKQKMPWESSMMVLSSSANSVWYITVARASSVLNHISILSDRTFIHDLLCYKVFMWCLISFQVDIAYVPFIERFQIFFSNIKNYDITAGRPNLQKFIEVVQNYATFPCIF